MTATISRIDGLAVWISLVLLAGGLIVQNGAFEDDVDLAAARSRIRNALSALPDVLGENGEWIKLSDDPVPPTQADMLGLNAHVSRTYQRLGSAPVRRAKVFIASSRDARSMAGHHPPNCYPKSGYEAESGAERGGDFQTSIGTVLPTRVYRFRGSTDESSSLIVVSGFLMPDGRAVATLEETSGLAARATTSRLGLAQFQIVFDGDLSATDVDRYAQEILGGIPGEVYLAIGGVVDGLEDAQQGGES